MIYKQLRYRLDHVLAAEAGAFGVGDETARVTIARKAPSTFFDHYRWRGDDFSDLCLYEYMKLVVVKTMASAITASSLTTPSTKPTSRTTQKTGVPPTTPSPSTARFLRTRPWRTVSAAATPRPTLCKTIWPSPYSLCWYHGNSCPPCLPESTVPPDAISITAQKSGSQSGQPWSPTCKMLLGTSNFSASAKRTPRWTLPCDGKLAELPRPFRSDR
jgi:hypothetical protein